MNIAIIALSIVVVAQAAAIFVLSMRWPETGNTPTESPAIQHMKRKHGKSAPIGSAVCRRTKELREKRG